MRQACKPFKRPSQHYISTLWQMLKQLRATQQILSTHTNVLNQLTGSWKLTDTVQLHHISWMYIKYFVTIFDNRVSCFRKYLNKMQNSYLAKLRTKVQMTRWYWLYKTGSQLLSNPNSSAKHCLIWLANVKRPTCQLPGVGIGTCFAHLMIGPVLTVHTYRASSHQLANAGRFCNGNKWLW